MWVYIGIIVVIYVSFASRFVFFYTIELYWMVFGFSKFFVHDVLFYCFFGFVLFSEFVGRIRILWDNT